MGVHDLFSFGFPLMTCFVLRIGRMTVCMTVFLINPTV